MNRTSEMLTVLYLLSAAASAQVSVPKGQVGAEVRPVRYELTFNINPSEDAFTAETRVEVILNEPRIEIWMHGKGIEVNRAAAELPNEQIIDAEFE